MRWFTGGSTSLVVALSRQPSRRPSAAAADVTVFAAASLKEAMDEQAKQFEASTGNKVIVSYGASNALAKQIEAGAPADIFISADLDWMDYVDQRNLLAPDTRVNLLRNTLVLIAPASSNATLKIAPNFGLAAALGTEKLAMANPDSVPAGKYGKSALEKLGVWTERREAGRARRERARRARARLARRGAVRHRLLAPTRWPTRACRSSTRFRRTAIRRSSIRRRCSRRASRRRRKPLLDYLRSAPARADLGEIRLRAGAIGHARTQPGRSRHPRAEPSRRARQRHLQPAARDRRRLRPGALLLSRQDAGRRDRPPAAGAAAGRRRLRAAGAVRQARPHRQRCSTSGSASCSRSAGPARRSPRRSWAFR